ncbi:MAG TPA: GNAT family N-acetyltransferase [Devosia sp.]
MSGQLLDNPVWHALGGPHIPLRQDFGPVRRYRPDVALFAAFEAPAAEPLDGLIAAIPEAGGAALVTPAPVDVPAGLSAMRVLPVLQMVAATPRPVAPATDAIDLGDEHVPQMLELVQLTQPGPFAARTIEMGRYIGIMEGDALVAMAGERMRLPGYTEVSAVCTHPDHRGRGHAKRLVSTLLHDITGRRETAFLHVLPDNRAAITAYEALGFTGRREMTFTAFARA